MSSPTITVRTPRDIIDHIDDHPTGSRTRLLAIGALVGGPLVDRLGRCTMVNLEKITR